MSQSQRTVMVQHVHPRLREAEIRTLFESAGSVVEVSMLQDVSTGRHRGIGYIEYTDVAGAAKAVETLHNVPLLNVGLAVSRVEDTPSAIVSETTTTSAQTSIDPIGRTEAYKTLYLYDLHPGVNEEDLSSLCECFGEVVEVEVLPPLAFLPPVIDASGSRVTPSSGRVSFAKNEDARVALDRLRGVVFAGLVLRVEAFDLRENDTGVSMVQDASGVTVELKGTLRQPVPVAAGVMSMAQYESSQELLEAGKDFGMAAGGVIEAPLLAGNGVVSRPPSHGPAPPGFESGPTLPMGTPHPGRGCAVIESVFVASKEQSPHWQWEVLLDFLGGIVQAGALHSAFLISDDHGRVFVRFMAAESVEIAKTMFNGVAFGDAALSVREVSDEEFVDAAEHAAASYGIVA